MEPSGQSLDRRFAPRMPRQWDVTREAGLARSASEHGRPIVLIEAPAGYGKSTFAAQSCAQDGRPTAWVNLRDSDNDAVRLLTRLVGALVEVHGLDPGVASPEFLATVPPVRVELLARLLDALPGGQPVQLVLDDVHAVHQESAVGVLRSLVEEWPARSRLVLVSRSQPDVSISRLRAGGDLSEIGSDDLVLQQHEAAEIAHSSGGHLGRTIRRGAAHAD